jgi:hypothetical protein
VLRIINFDVNEGLRIFCNRFTQVYVAELSLRKFEDVYICLDQVAAPVAVAYVR